MRYCVNIPKFRFQNFAADAAKKTGRSLGGVFFWRESHRQMVYTFTTQHSFVTTTGQYSALHPHPPPHTNQLRLAAFFPPLPRIFCFLPSSSSYIFSYFVFCDSFFLHPAQHHSILPLLLQFVAGCFFPCKRI